MCAGPAQRINPKNAQDKARLTIPIDMFMRRLQSSSSFAGKNASPPATNETPANKCMKQAKACPELTLSHGQLHLHFQAGLGVARADSALVKLEGPPGDGESEPDAPAGHVA